MMKTRIIKENNKPIAVILDYAEYRKLVEAKHDRDDYASASKVKESNKKWISHKDLKKELGI